MDNIGSKNILTRPIRGGCVLTFIKGLFGIAAMIFLYAIFSGDFFGTIFGLIGGLLLIVVCTAGMALLPLIPAILVSGLLVGFLIDLFLKFIRGSSAKSPNSNGVASENQKIEELTNNDLAVMQYITYSRRASKISDDEIKKNLLGAGWSETIIDNAFRRCNL